MPDTVSQAIPKPSVYFNQFSLNVGQPEIINPASLDLLDLLHPLIESHGSGFPGYLFKLGF
jgi:hypothetical protein